MRRTPAVTLLLVAVLAMLTLACSPLGRARAAATKAVGEALEQVEAEATEQAQQEAEATVAATEAAEAGEGEGGASGGPMAACFADFPAYASCRPDDDATAMARILGAAVPESQALGFATDAAWQRVRDFYKQQAPGQGWEAAPLEGGDAAGHGVTMWWGKDTRLVLLFIAQAEEGTGSTVAMVCGKEQQ